MFVISGIGAVLLKVWYVILAFLILMLMVTVHELGHYLSGKLLKFKINEFAIGMGPKIYSKTKKNGEVFSVRAFPLGGFCAFEGENDDGVATADAFNKQKPWKRLIVLFGGAFFNFLFAILICFILFVSYGETVTMVGTRFGYADQAVQELNADDIIYEINGKRVYLIDSISSYMDADDLTVTVYRQDGTFKTINVKKQKFYLSKVSQLKRSYIMSDGRELAVGDQIYKIDDVYLSEQGHFFSYLHQVIGDDENKACNVEVLATDGKFYNVTLPAKELLRIEIEEQSYSGLGISPITKLYKYPFWTRMGRIVPYCGQTGVVVLKTLGGIFTGSTPLTDLGGPITTISITSQVVSYGLSPVLLLIVLISVNLAVFNLLPVPALDGCQMVFVIIEWITKKPIKPKVQAMVNGIGLVLLIGLVVLLDITKLF